MRKPIWADNPFDEAYWGNVITTTVSYKTSYGIKYPPDVVSKTMDVMRLGWGLYSILPGRPTSMICALERYLEMLEQ